MTSIKLEKLCLPRKETFIIDTSIFGELEKEKRRVDYLNCIEKVALRNKKLEQIFKALSSNSDWFTIPEVVEEFTKSDAYFEMIRQKTILPQKINYASKRNFSRSEKTHRKYLLKKDRKERIQRLEKVVSKIQKTRRKINLLITDRAFSPKEIFLEDQLNYFKMLLPEIEKVHKEFNQTPNKLNTDCKLIASAITYGINQPITIYSEDNGLLKTYSKYILRNHPEIKNNFRVLSSRFRENVTCAGYSNSLKH